MYILSMLGFAIESDSIDVDTEIQIPVDKRFNIKPGGPKIATIVLSGKGFHPTGSFVSYDAFDIDGTWCGVGRMYYTQI